MKYKSLLLIFMFLSVLNMYGQHAYALKIETGYLKYMYNTVVVDPGPNWQGYNLPGTDGFDINIINGLLLHQRFFVGIGVGYLNFEGINGFSAYSDFEYLPFKSPLTLLINLKTGYNHVWNQYENGSGTAMAELNLGVNYKFNSRMSGYIKSGFLVTQQALLWPIRIGFRL